MRSLFVGILAVSLVVGKPTMAGKESTKDAPAVKAANTAPTASQPATGANSLEAELEQLRSILEAQARQLAEQQKKVEVLEAELNAARANPTPVSATEPAKVNTLVAAQEQNAEQVGKLEKEVSQNLQSLEERSKKLGPFSLSGDLRLREEPFFGGPTDRSLDRNRLRYRARLYLNAKLNDDLSGGFAIASGDTGDPISTNQTSNQFYTRKAFNLDRAFLTYTPHGFKPFSFTGGKFAYPWYNTELTWDKDLSPEGVAETLAYNSEGGFLKRAAIVGFQLPFSEVAGVQPTNKSIVQSVVYGSQGQLAFGGEAFKVSLYSGLYNWHNADPVALAVAKASLSNPQSPQGGTVPLKSNSVQNSIFTTAYTIPVNTTNGGGTTNVNTTTVNAQFASKFELVDSILRLDIKTGADRWPLMFLGDFVHNYRACDNLPNINTTPTLPVGATNTSKFNATCDPRQDNAYWLEGRFGRQSKKNDWQLAYTRMFIEREAVLGVFNFSEIRQGSNVSQHRAEVFYQAHKNVQLSFAGFFGRPLNLGNSAPPENILKQLQFDVTYKF